MKKTLLGALAFVLVLATLLSGVVLAADDTNDTTNVGEVLMVDRNHPIKVDGQMDEAYTSAVPLPICFYDKNVVGRYTHGWARFVWSKAENALYCHVIMNDSEVAPVASLNTLWVSDSVEMLLDLTNTGTQEWGIEGLEGDGALKRGLQYRIDGFKGIASGGLTEEKASSYTYNEVLGRFTNNKNLLINENRNILGWEYSDDPYKTGWSYALTRYGYMVEYRINAGGQGITLADGHVFRFDFQINDRFNVDASGYGEQSNLFYASTYRSKTGMAASGSVIGYYDTMTLSEKVATNTYAAVAEAKLSEYGMADPTIELTTTTKATLRTYTSKVTINREFTAREEVDKVTTKKNTVTTKSTTTGAAPAAKGCGGSLALGTSLAVLATVGAAGFFAFRRKDEE